MDGNQESVYLSVPKLLLLKSGVIFFKFSSLLIFLIQIHISILDQRAINELNVFYISNNILSLFTIQGKYF
jgi:hypothetical protein